ncbi:hypothetical protein BBW65_02255 [Helicobacter enhydrae]|uniref:Chaperone NapD n=1 Tax=Helicobacter enhydrae TaxID=222136 RepID=A0A1B1U4M1_9HELI|nr:chaperone NapD [Helicobacter enhydrae]ANV97698.1 hypothetical protein BBW65_02255 [Helicobacter enhydrae]
MNISSVIVYVQEDFQQVCDSIKKIPQCEVCLEDAERKIAIVAIEAKEIAEEVQVLEKLNALSGVLRAEMHYSYSEDELDKAKEQIQGSVSEILQEDYPAEAVRYSGSVGYYVTKERDEFEK